MRLLITICGLLFMVLTTIMPINVQAAESDTHFRAAYIKARLFGYSHDYALFVAKHSQGVDESLLSSAFLFSNQRRLNHFHGDTSPTEEPKSGFFGKLRTGFKAQLALAERNHALANLFIWVGLKTGSGRLFGFGLHHLTDSYWHAGYSNLWGHMENDHAPDDTSKDTAKYNSYVRGVGEALKAGRNSVGDWGKDFDTAIKLLSPVARRYHDFQRDLTAEDFQNNTLISDLVVKYEELQNLHMKDVQKDPVYKKAAYQKVWESLVRNRVIEPQVNFSDFFQKDMIEDRQISVERGVQLTLREQILKMYHGEPSAINLDASPNQGSKMVLYLRDQINPQKLSVETNRYLTRLLSYLNLQDNANRARQQLLGIVDTTVEEQASNRIAQFDIEEAELITSLESDIRQRTLENLALLREFTRLNGGTVDAWTLYLGRSQILPDGATADDIGRAHAEIINLAKDLAANQKAAQIATGFCKDFVPVRFNSWVKTQFALNGEMRDMEVMIKDELYRRFIEDKFGQNFVNDKRNIAIDMVNLGGKFIRSIRKQAGPKYTEYQLEAMRRVAELAEEAGWKSSSRDSASTVAFSWRTRLKIPLLLAPVTLITFPLAVGSVVFRKLTDYAYKYAKQYQTMDDGDFKKAQEEKVLKQFNKNEILKGIIVKTPRRVLVCNKAQATY